MVNKLDDDRLNVAKAVALKFGQLIRQAEHDGDEELRKKARGEWLDFRNGFRELEISPDQYKEIIKAHWAATTSEALT